MSIFKKVKTHLSYQYRLMFKPDTYVLYRSYVNKGNKAKGKNFKKAYENFKKAYEINQKDHRSAVQMVHAMRHLYDKKDVNSVLFQLKEKFDTIPQIWRELGKQYLKSDVEQASVFWGKAYHLETNHLNTGITYIRTLVGSKNDSEALNVINQLLEIFPDEPKLLELAEFIYFKNGRIFGNDQTINKLLKKRPDSWQLRQIIGAKLLNKIIFGLQERDEHNKKLSISLHSRPNFFANPKEHLAIATNNVHYKFLDKIRRTSAASKPPINPETKRLLVVSDSNWNFTENLVKTLVDDSAYEIRTLEFNDRGTEFNTEIRILMGNIIADKMIKSRSNIKYKQGFYHQELIDWADTIFIEWCNYPAVWLSHFLLPDKKVVVRLHSYEAFSFWPHLVNWGNVNHLIFIAPQIREFLLNLIDIESFGTKTSVIPNFNNLEQFNLPKLEFTEKVIGMIGYNNANKNPLFALQVLKQLIKEDKDWKLLLVGHPFPEKSENDYEEKYKNEFFSFIEKNALTENVIIHEFSRNLPKVIQKMGWIISASEREGTHESVLQAMASGTVPLVKNWPIFENYGGARNIYSEEFTFDHFEEIVTFIQQNSSAENYKTVSEKAKKYTFKNFDLQPVYQQFKSILQ